MLKEKETDSFIFVDTELCRVAIDSLNVEDGGIRKRQGRKLTILS